MKRAIEDAEFLYHKKISAITRRRMVTASRVNQFKIPLSLTIIILLLFFAICAASFLYYNSQKQAIKAEKQGDLLTIAALKLNQLTTWRENQIDDAQLIVDNIYFPYRIQQWLNNESISGLREEILSWMADRCSRADYKDCLLLDVKGAVRLSTATESAPLPDPITGLYSGSSAQPQTRSFRHHQGRCCRPWLPVPAVPAVHCRRGGCQHRRFYSVPH